MNRFQFPNVHPLILASSLSPFSDPDLIQSVLSGIGLLISALVAIAVLNLENNPKGRVKFSFFGRELFEIEKAKIRKWVIRALVTSIFVGIFAFVFDYSSKKAASKQTEAILSDIQTSLSPFTNVKVSFQLTYELKGSQSLEYARRVESEVNGFMKRLGTLVIDDELVWYLHVVPGKGVLPSNLLLGMSHEFWLPRGSTLLPAFHTEDAAFGIINETSVRIRLFKKPVEISLFDHQIDSSDPEPDLDVSLDDNQTTPFEKYFRSTGVFSVEGHEIPIDNIKKSSDNPFLSTRELPGSQIVFLSGDVGLPGEKVEAEMRQLWINVADLPTWKIPLRKVTCYCLPDGRTVYQYRFPPEHDQMLKELEGRQ